MLRLEQSADAMGSTYSVAIYGYDRDQMEAAVQAAITKAHKTVEKLSWFEVGDIRGHIGEDGKVKEYQVVLKVAFQLME